MNTEVVSQLYLAVCAGTIVTTHWRVWRHSVPGFLAGRISRASCLARAAGWMFLGLLVPTGVLLSLVGIEEVVNTPLVPERIALATAGLTLLQLVAGLVSFSLAVAQTRLSRPPPLS